MLGGVLCVYGSQGGVHVAVSWDMGQKSFSPRIASSRDFTGDQKLSTRIMLPPW